MAFIIWISVILISLYTAAFGWSMWKEKNRLGASVAFALAVIIVLLPKFTVLK
ncbi:hypothetical protein [Peribacillus sp. SCS-155]|uniref:hypothetical protein n=1 Tax=Peribacillus sedimenti TaxID=3115297 RepID=UPI003906AF8C